MNIIPVEELSHINSAETLFGFLHKTLQWPVDYEDPFWYHLTELNAETEQTRVSAGQIPPFGDSDPFALVLVEFEGDFRRTSLREILRDIKRQMRERDKLHGRSIDDIIFICPSSNYSAVRFARFEERQGRQPKLSVFGWDSSMLDTTATLRRNNLDHLRFPAGRNLFELDPEPWRKQWAEAWNVEAVTQEFFKRYKEIFEAAKTAISNIAGDKHLFTQRLFNRLLFIHFLSKKGWLTFNGDTNYLKALWDGRDRTGNFYNSHLIPLFFCGLNNPQCQDLLLDNPALHSRIGDVKFLNGGLFEKAEDDEQGELIPDSVFQSIIEDLFLRHNFTKRKARQMMSRSPSIQRCWARCLKNL